MLIVFEAVEFLIGRKVYILRKLRLFAGVGVWS